MIVIADTSPLNYLVLTDCEFVLPRLFGQVFLPPAVAKELTHSAAPQPVRHWIEHPPHWLTIREAGATTIESVRASGARLGRGEVEAIALAKEMKADLLLMDERLATQEARQRHHLRVTGVLGVLRLAAAQGLIDLPSVIGRLGSTSFLMPKATVEELLKEDVERKRRGFESNE